MAGKWTAVRPGSRRQAYKPQQCTSGERKRCPKRHKVLWDFKIWRDSIKFIYGGKLKKLKSIFSFLLQLHHMLEWLYMAPCGMERSVPISTYCSPAANSNICHPLNVHLGKHQVQGARVPLPSPCFNGLCQHGMWEGKKGIAKEESCLDSGKEFRYSGRHFWKCMGTDKKKVAWNSCI